MTVSAKKFEIGVFNSILAEKQQLFRSIRSGYSENNNKKVQMISENSETNRNCSSEAYMEKLLAEVKNSDGVRICNKILDEGIHNSLVQNLRKNMDVEVSLQLISAILTKQKVKIANKFVRLGLLQQILRHTETRANIDICMNILANIVFENVEYAEMMLQNKVHHQLFELFRKVVFNKQNLEKVDQQTGFTIMWALASLLQVQNTMPYKLPFLQILEFALQVFKKELYIGIIIQIIFLVGYSFRDETQNLATWVISSILNQVSTQSRYIQNLLILIKLLSPIDIDYSKISTLAMTAEGKIISYCLKILQKIVNVYPNSIPRNFEWWERYYIKITRPQDIEYFTCLLTKSKIRLQFVYRVVHDILEKYCPSHLTISNEALICINSLLEGSQNPEQRKKTKFYLKSSNIIHQLQRLYESKNAQIHRKSEYLLTAINSNL